MTDVAQESPAQEIIRYGKCELNLTARIVRFDNGEAAHLAPMEQEILAFLMGKAGETTTKEMILDHVYKGVDEAEMKIIDVYICKIRRKLPSLKQHIKTVWGRGYRFVTPS